MKVKTDPISVWNEYERCKQYNDHIGLYETVKQNENFFVGKQWEGVHADDIDLPVFNILKRSVAYFVSNIVSDDIAVNADVFGQRKQSEEYRFIKSVIEKSVDEAVELSRLKDKFRDVLRNAAVDGDGCVYFYFDEKKEIGLPNAKGAIVAEVLANTNVLFGDSTNPDVQAQPYIILYTRRDVEAVREEAKANGNGEWEQIRSDGLDPNMLGGEYTGDRNVTVIIKMWRENGTVHFLKTTRDQIVKKPTDLGYRRYPVAFMNWERVRNSYHGMAAVTGMIPNQIYINKMFAMGMQFTKNTAFPKIVYNQALIREWDNTPGSAVPVVGNPNDAVAVPTRSVEMSQSVISLLERTINYTRDTMGATDAALGNVSPDNTSAIIAVQQASAMPLELNRRAFQEFAEDCVRNIVDIISLRYGVRPVDVDMEEARDPYTPLAPDVVLAGDMIAGDFDFDTLRDMALRLSVTIGVSAYWSETMQMQTMTNLFTTGIITDPRIFLEMVPDKFLANKSALLRSLDKSDARAQMLAQEQMAQEQAMAMGGMPFEQVPVMPSGNADQTPLLPQ